MNAINVHSDLPLRIGLLGGTFNPIHRGHLKVADEVLRCCKLEQIYFIPSAQPPHKSSESLADASDRYEMVRLALHNHPRMIACDTEIRRSGPSYTVDTLNHFKSRQRPEGKLFFILGADAFIEIDTWWSFDRLFELAAMVVIARPPSAPFGSALCQTMETYVKRQIDPAYQLDRRGRVLKHPHKMPIHLTDIGPIDIASTQIRKMLKKGQSVDQWMTPEVLGYIVGKGLYQ